MPSENSFLIHGPKTWHTTYFIFNRYHEKVRTQGKVEICDTQPFPAWQAEWKRSLKKDFVSGEQDKIDWNDKNILALTQQNLCKCLSCY